MITLQKAMELGNFIITGGAKHEWKCFGPNARFIDFEPDYSNKSYGIIFDSRTQEVYQVSVCDYVTDNCYRINNPDYVEDYYYEADSRGVNGREAYDDVNYVDLETEEEFIEKAHAIINDLPYDERVIVSVDLPESVIYELMKNAHELDITLNQYMEKVLEKEINRILEEQEQKQKTT